ncbi:hypothetical protein Nepgr_021120 [Nepenthes gracilis]|uniref:Uncharacterized protein n=1 Tax=Nepenthes gracilis TaxID=150966 RepID=A0AAD3SYY2_NEPGR|nr:hypothetical protein Nepgr_021120 [Nepenthes gracilis]
MTVGEVSRQLPLTQPVSLVATTAPPTPAPSAPPKLAATNTTPSAQSKLQLLKVLQTGAINVFKIRKSSHHQRTLGSEGTIQTSVRCPTRFLRHLLGLPKELLKEMYIKFG